MTEAMVEFVFHAELVLKLTYMGDAGDVERGVLSHDCVAFWFEYGRIAREWDVKMTTKNQSRTGQVSS